MSTNSLVSDAPDTLPTSPPLQPPPHALYTPWQRYGFLAVLFLVSTSNYFDYYILSVVLEPIKREFQVSDTLLGLLSGFCFALVYAFAGFPIARWADRGNRRLIIAVALAGWSVITMSCALARNFWQLALARFGLGVVEPGALPPSQSLIADYFPPERRATALAVLTTASAAGYLFGVAMGGYIAASYGWRAAFLWAGAPGLLLALVARLTLAEPRLQLGFPAAREHPEKAPETALRLCRKRSYLFALIGLSVYCVFAFGENIFLPSLMIRTLHATLKQVSVLWGISISLASVVGAVGGGWLADRLHSRDVRWYAWLPAVACALAMPLYWAAFASTHLRSFILLDFLAEAVVTAGVPVAYAAMHAVCGSQRRAVAIAAAQFALTLLGAGFGPLLVGLLSDAFGARYGAESLRYSLITLTLFLVPAAAAFYYSSHALPRDLED